MAEDVVSFFIALVLVWSKKTSGEKQKLFVYVSFCRQKKCGRTRVFTEHNRGKNIFFHGFSSCFV